MPRAKDGKQVKDRVSVRVEPQTYLDIVKQYGSFTVFVNKAIEKMVELSDKKEGKR